MVTGQYFQTLQVQPAVGRLFGDDDVRNATGDPEVYRATRSGGANSIGDPGVVGSRGSDVGCAAEDMGETM
jgi:hypothetical protein